MLLIVAEEDLHAVGPPKVGDGEVQLLHEQFHDLVHPFMDDKRCKPVHLRLLEINHDKLSTILDALEGHVAGWCDTHTGTHSDD